MSIAVKVEVTAELRPTRKANGNMQVYYVDLGGRYPVERLQFVRESGPVKPGHYLASKLKISGYDIALDLDSLTPATAAGRVAAA